MKALDLYYKSFKGTTLADLYRDKVEDEIKARGYRCSDDELINFVDYKTEQLILLFSNDRRKELFSSGVLREAVLYLLIPRLDESIREFNNTGVYQTLYDVSFILRVYVEVIFLKAPGLFSTEEMVLASVHAKEALKTLALMASWVPDETVTDKHREFRASLLGEAQALADKISIAFQNKKRKPKSLTREYQDFKHRCIELIYMIPTERPSY